MGQIKWELCFFVSKALEFGFAFLDGETSEIQQRQGAGGGLRDYLTWLVIEHGEGCTQNLVAAQQLSERLFECHYVECAVETDGGGKVVSRTVRDKLVQKPKAQLSEGKCGRRVRLRAARDDLSTSTAIVLFLKLECA